ncbi:MAG: hypothetical protein ACXWUN_01495 [Allosphingosinicella sp.]
MKFAKVVQATDRRGRAVACLTPAVPPPQTELGRHKLRQGQRLDHLAAHYLEDPAGFWRIAELNDAMNPESALDTALVGIPTKG